jgi:hypothetical protein
VMPTICPWPRVGGDLHHHVGDAFVHHPGEEFSAPPGGRAWLSGLGRFHCRSCSHGADETPP